MKPLVTAFFDETTNTICYVVADQKGTFAAVIDSALDFDYATGRTDMRAADKIIDFTSKDGLKLAWNLETQLHGDHLSAAPYFREKLGGKIGIGKNTANVQDTFGNVFNECSEFQRDGRQFDAFFEGGDSFHIGPVRGDVVHTPGNTPACMTNVIGDAAFVGDTL